MQRLVVLMAGALVVASCNRGDRSNLHPADHVYTLKGRVTSVDPSAPTPHVSVHHESIPSFVSRSGERVGMNSMTMSFAVAPSAALDGISEGEPIEFTFEVRWNHEPAMLITSLHELPAASHLELGN